LKWDEYHDAGTQQKYQSRKQAVQRDLELVEKSRILGYVIDDILKYYKDYRRIKSQLISNGDLDRLRELKQELA
jgi:hypothetical protein